jgi:transposase
MKKGNTAKKSAKAHTKTEMKAIREMGRQQRLTIGLDLGDRAIHYCILNNEGDVVGRDVLAATQTGLNSLLEKMPSCRVALEVGTHSPWVSRQAVRLGHEVIVANARRLQLITKNSRKSDRVDAELLARMARLDPELMGPIQHRGETAQADLAVIRARAALMKSRTMLVNAARGLVKPMGERLNKSDADQVSEDLSSGLSAAAQGSIQGILRTVETITEEIHSYDEQIQQIAKRYPELELLTQVYGVGTLIGLTYMLTLDDPHRFKRSRDVGPFLGLAPKQQDSGESAPELSISKEGDKLLRSLLVEAAHCVMRKNAPDSDLRRWGLKKATGGKRAKRRALVGVARKLAVLLHRLWVTGEVYDPLYQSNNAEKSIAA